MKWSKYNNWIIIKEVTKIGNQRYCKCKCICWNIKDVQLSSLKNWWTKSCWCKRWAHWMRSTKIYKVFDWIKQRITNKNNSAYKYYWARWIKCEWKNFIEFYKDMWDTYKEWLQIDRENNDWNYCKSNCRWVTQKVNANNKRTTIYLTNNWEKKTLKEWSEIKWIRYNLAYERYKKQYNFNDIFMKINIQNWRSLS